MPELAKGSVPLVPAARRHWANMCESGLVLPELSVVRDPEPSTPIEHAWSDWDRSRNQVKAGRWRYDYRTSSWRGVNRGTRNTNLCDYDKDVELRARYQLEKSMNYPPSEFIKDASEWQDAFRQPQEEQLRLARAEQARVLEEWFGESDRALEEFKGYCHRIGVKVW